LVYTKIKFLLIILNNAMWI